MPGDALRDRPLAQTLLGERNEQRRGLGGHASIASTPQNRFLVCASPDGAFRRNHGDVAGPGRQTGRFRSRLDDAHDRHTPEPLADPGHACGRRRVARNDQALHAVIGERLRGLKGVARDSLWALGSVRETGGIAEIDEALVRQLRRQRLQNRQSSDA